MLRPDTMPTVIISVEEGTNCGNVEQILFNRKRKCIDSFVVSKLDENGIPLTEDDVDYVLPFSDLEGMGDYAIIIMRDSVILKKKGQAERKEVYLGKSTLIGDIVVSLKGNKVGTVVDCEFSEEGDISSIFVELTKSEKVERFDAFSVMSIGNGIVIVRTTEQDVSPFKKNDVVQDFVRTKENPEYSYIKHDWNMKSEETDLSVVPAVEQTEASDVEDKADEITQFIPKMEVVKEVCNKVAIMSEGRIVEEGGVHHIFAEPKNEITKEFISYVHQQTDTTLNYLHHKGKKIIKAKFLGISAQEPIISKVIKEYGIDINILGGTIDKLSTVSIGHLYLELDGDLNAQSKAIELMQTMDVIVEVIYNGD